MRVVVPVCVLAIAVGCSFDVSGVGDLADAASDDAASDDAASDDAASDDAAAPADARSVDAMRPPDPADATPIDAASPDDCPDDDDLVACWRFEVDEHPAQPWDDSSYGNHGTAVNASFTTGRSGLALSVDASSSVKVPDSPSLDVPATITMEMWLRARALPVTSRAGLLDDNGQYGLFLTSAGQVRCAIASTTVTGLAIDVDEWTHVACVYDGATVTLYQDGVAGSMVFFSGAITTAPTDGIAIGQNSPSGDPLDGELDTVRVWRVPRTPEQLCQAAGTCSP